MRNALLFLWAAITYIGSLSADLTDLWVTNNQGTVGSPGSFVSVVDMISGKVEGYVDCTGFDLTHPIDINFNSDFTKAYVTCDNVHSVFVIDVSTRKVVGKVDDILGPFTAPAVMDINLNVIPNIAYVTNEGNNTVSIINLSVDVVTGTVDDTLGPFNLPIGVGFSNDGTKAFVANFNGHNVSAIDTATNTVTGYVNDVVHPFNGPIIVGWSGSTKAYIGDLLGGFVNVVVGNSVTGTVSTTGFPPFTAPINIVEGPDGTMYITDFSNNNVYLANPLTDAVTHVFTGTFSAPVGVSITHDNTTAYVCNSGNNTVSIVDVATRTQTAVVDASSFPFFTPYQAQLDIIQAPPPPPPISIPLRPICIHGNQKTDRFAAQSEVYNTITWCASPSLSTTKYNLYRNGALLKSFGVSDELIFEEHDVTETIVYSVTAVGSTGDESPAVTVSLP